MKCYLQFALFVSLAIIFMAYEARGAMEEKPCPAVVQDLTKKQLSGISGCTKSMKFKNPKEKAKKTACIMKCVLKKEALVDEKGQLTWDQFALFLDKHFPPSLQEKANATFRPCVENSLKGLDDEEEFCADYDPMIKCLLAVFPNMCA